MKETPMQELFLRNQDDFKQFIQYLLEDLGVRKQDLTRNIGINRVTIHRIMTGKAQVTKRSLRLANLYLSKMQQQLNEYTRPL